MDETQKVDFSGAGRTDTPCVCVPYHPNRMKPLILCLAVISAIAAASSVCKPLSTILQELPKGENSWLNRNGDTCFSLTLDLESKPPGRTEADLRSYYGMYVAGAKLHETNLIRSAAQQPALSQQEQFAIILTEYNKCKVGAGIPLATLQAQFLDIMNKASAPKRALYGTPKYTSLASMELLYTDPQHYKLSFHAKSDTPTFYYQNGKPTTFHPEYTTGTKFTNMERTKSYSTDLTSGTWSIEYHTTAGSSSPLSTVQLGVALNGRALTNTLEPVSNISQISPRRMHYVVNGDGAGVMPGARTMPFAIVGGALASPACTDLKSVYTASGCASSSKCASSVGCGILKSMHKSTACHCPGSSRL